METSLAMILWIAMGGAVGSVFRYLLGGPITTLVHGRFPLGTLVINVTGGLLIGFLSRGFFHMQATPELRAALIVGLCGGFTTFSTFSIETIGLIEGGLYMRASLYIVLSVCLSLLATITGIAAAKFVFSS